MILSKVQKYYFFRLKQFFRIANNSLESFFIYTIFGLIIYFYDLKIDWAFLIYYIIPPLYYHSNRKDLLFIKQTFINKYYLILLSEYLIIYLIIFSLTFGKGNLFIHFLGLLFCFVYPLINIKKKEWTKKINFSYLPSETYEWKSYIRSKPLYFILFFIFLIISSYHPFTLGIMIFLFCDIINSVYSIIEPKEIYCSYFSYKNLNDKLKKSLLIINLTILIPIFMSLILNFNLSYITFIYIFVLNMFSATIILSKYSNYNLDYRKVSPKNMGQIISIFVSIILIIPWIFDFFQLKKKAQYKISRYV